MTSKSCETICSVIVQSSWGKGDYFFHFAFIINGSKPVELLERGLQQRKTSSVYCEVCTGAKIIQGGVWGETQAHFSSFFSCWLFCGTCPEIFWLFLSKQTSGFFTSF